MKNAPMFGLQRYFDPIGVIVLPTQQSRVAHLILRDVHDGRTRLACSATAHLVSHLRPHVTRRPLCSRCRALLVRWWPDFSIGEHIVGKDWKPSGGRPAPPAFAIFSPPTRPSSRRSARSSRSRSGSASERFVLVADDNGHWYVVPVLMMGAWEEWVSLDHNDEVSWTVPSYAQEVGGAPNLVTFTDPVIR